MKIFIHFVLAFCIVTISCNAQTSEINASEFELKLKDSKVQVLDVRTPGEYQSAHIKNALQADWLDQKQFQERTQHLNKSAPILLYCASGVRSRQAMRWLAQKGFTNMANLKGGLTAWKLEGKSVVAKAAQPEMTIADYQSGTKMANVVLVDIGAEWCPPCKKMEPVLQELEKKLPNAFKLFKVDGGNDLAVMKSVQFVALPTFIIYKNGKETWRKQGIVSYEDLKTALTK
jgi:rhodanese-related sulfurtransferase